MNHFFAALDPVIHGLPNRTHQTWPCCFRPIGLILVLLSLVSGVSRLEAADATVIIPGGDGPFTTNIVFNNPYLGAHKTLWVAPASGYRFKAEPTTNFNSSVIMVQQTSYTECGAMYELWLVGNHQEGTAQISGTITPGSCNGGGGTSGHGGGGGTSRPPPPDRDFSIGLYLGPFIYFTVPTNGTNLTASVGSSTDIATKVVLGDATAPASGTVTFSAPSNLGTISPSSVALGSGGTATSRFYAGNLSGSGTITATGSNLRHSSGTAAPNVSTNIVLNVLKADLDIRETAQPQNRIGRDDSRQEDTVRNRILVWASGAADNISFDLIKPPNITGPVCIEIIDRCGQNSATLPHFERLDVASKTFNTYTVAEDSVNPDLEVRFGTDLNSDNHLTGTEITGTYHVYGVTREEYAESRNNYTYLYLPAMTRMADELHRRFANGAFTVGNVWAPDNVAATAVVDATKNARYTHHVGGAFAADGFANTASGRMYYRANVTLPIYHYNNKSQGAGLIRNRDELREGLNTFVGGLTWAAIKARYDVSPGGLTRSVAFNLNGAAFDLGFTPIGLFHVNIDSTDPYNGSGTITLQVTRNDANYEIAAGATIDLTLHDIFDFSYFTPVPLGGLSDIQFSPPMIQHGFGQPGSFSPTTGQVGLVEVKVDGAVTTRERIVAP